MKEEDQGKTRDEGGSRGYGNATNMPRVCVCRGVLKAEGRGVDEEMPRVCRRG
jgi:hypothetical protein